MFIVITPGLTMASAISCKFTRFYIWLLL